MRSGTVATLWVSSLLAAGLSACGGEAPPPQDATDAEDVDVIASLVGDDVEIVTDEEGEAPEEYTGPTTLTVNLKVVNEKNPEGSFALIKADGTKLIENGALGEPTMVDQGGYTLEFRSPLVFGDPVYTVEDVAIQGKEISIDETFPAGQITLHTYTRKPEGKCVPKTFSVKSIATGDERDLPGKGKTCEPLIVQPGTYEVLLDISKRKVQPVEMQVNSEQVATRAVQLER